jgi:hypothetical protein
MTKGEDSTSRALMIPFLAIHAKRGRNEPKAKGPHHHQFQKLSVEYFSISILFSIGILSCSKGGESSISQIVYQNPLEH